MRSRNDIIEALARERRVEAIVGNIAHCGGGGGGGRLPDNLQDLSQMIYEILLGYSAARLEEVTRRGAINFLITRIVLNQYRSTNSRYWREYRNRGRTLVSLDGRDWADGDDLLALAGKRDEKR